MRAIMPIPPVHSEPKKGLTRGFCHFERSKAGCLDSPLLPRFTACRLASFWPSLQFSQILEHLSVPTQPLTCCSFHLSLVWTQH